MTPAAASGTTNITNATSYNWTGYRLKGTDPNHIYYTSVAGNWSVPYFDPPNNSVQESASQWVGIGSGDTGWDQLIQAGTVAYTGPGWNGIGPSGTYGFYESYPLQSEVIIQNLPVNSGDVAGASVSYIARSNTMIWVVCSSSANNTCVSGTEALGSTVGTYAEQAEWIMERHSVNGLNTLLLPFVRADYYGATYKEWRGGSTVSDTYILNQGPTGPGLTLDNIAMVDCGGTPTLASTGSLDSQGNFSTFSYHQGTAC
ncbi:G1 family glutamic endopeptidase [Microbacterium sp. 2MCAF23]|uniref:G1 family glutamic endopeptidase n=1 Tax=Microbacterium sp. 2MCAF23 TaxID=3232985 RepID=UPI003F9C8FD8